MDVVIAHKPAYGLHIELDNRRVLDRLILSPWAPMSAWQFSMYANDLLQGTSYSGSTSASARQTRGTIGRCRSHSTGSSSQGGPKDALPPRLCIGPPSSGRSLEALS